MIDVKEIRKDFPILQRMVNGKPLVYLDNAATSQKPRQVIEAITNYYANYNSNIHRGVHTLSMEATTSYEEARAKCASFIGAADPSNVLFVRNTTEAINLVARAWALQRIEPGDEILLSEMEHHSNLVPWQQVAQATGATLRFIPLTSDWTLDLANVEPYFTPRTRMVAITQMSNVLGTIVPIKELVKHAKKVGAWVLVDAAQSAPHLSLNVQDLGCDFLAFSGHKMLGPTGIGVLYVAPECLPHMDPFLHGGEMVREVTQLGATWNELPWRFEAGTPNIADTIALGAAIDYLTDVGMDNIRQHEMQLTRYALQAFEELGDQIDTYGPQELDVRGGIVSFNASSVHPHDLGTVLDGLGIAIRTGHHCAQPLHRKMGLSATARASFYIYNQESEVDSLVEGLRKALRYFGDRGRAPDLGVTTSKGL